VGAVESERGDAGQGEAAASNAAPAYLLHIGDQLRALVTGHTPPEDVRVEPFLDGGLGRVRHGHGGHSTQRRKPQQEAT